MKRIISISLTLLLIVALAVPAFASELNYNGAKLPSHFELYEELSASGFTHCTIFKQYDEYVLYFYQTDAYVNSAGTFLSLDNSGPVRLYEIKNGRWALDNTVPSRSWLADLSWQVPYWSSHDIYTDSTKTSVLLSASAPTEPLCDGSVCPATDADHDNICDDCGNVMAMSLRSELYQYVIGYTDRYVENNPQYGYRIITKDSDGRYSVYISTSLGTYNSATDTLTFADGKQTFVTEKADGSFVGDGWAILTSIPNAMSFRDTIYYSNYTIEGFFPPPLWETMGQVTQGEMGALTAETVGTMKVLVVCGVGLIALLLVLNLFGKRSLIFRG